jgi:hypothetical protein
MIFWAPQQKIPRKVRGLTPPSAVHTPPSTVHHQQHHPLHRHSAGELLCLYCLVPAINRRHGRLQREACNRSRFNTSRTPGPPKQRGSALSPYNYKFPTKEADHVQLLPPQSFLRACLFIILPGRARRSCETPSTPTTAIARVPRRSALCPLAHSSAFGQSPSTAVTFLCCAPTKHNERPHTPFLLDCNLARLSSPASTRAGDLRVDCHHHCHCHCH